MQIKRINDNTISCTLSPEDLRANGFRLDDFFERKKEAVEFIRATVAKAAIAENFNLQGELTTMRVTVLPDHSLNLLITREDTREGAAREVRKIAQSLFESIAARALEKASGKNSDDSSEDDPDRDTTDGLLEAILAGADSGEGAAEENSDAQAGKNVENTFMFSFYSVRDAMDCCRIFADPEQMESSFYYLREDDTYFLILHRTSGAPSDFERRVLSANEFGELVTSNEQYISFVTEHGICIARDHAVEMFTGALAGKEPSPEEG